MGAVWPHSCHFASPVTPLRRGCSGLTRLRSGDMQIAGDRSRAVCKGTVLRLPYKATRLMEPGARPAQCQGGPPWDSWGRSTVLRVWQRGTGCSHSRERDLRPATPHPCHWPVSRLLGGGEHALKGPPGLRLRLALGAVPQQGGVREHSPPALLHTRTPEGSLKIPAFTTYSRAPARQAL